MGNDGDLELQTQDAPPTAPWNPGPNSVVKISSDAQSPFRNLFPRGEFGIHLPSRGEYDGFGWTVSNIQPDGAGRLFVSLDFRCSQTNQNGTGSWRYYIGHGAGSSAAIELFWNGIDFFRRKDHAIEAINSIEAGQWYQLQLTLNFRANTYTGLLASTSSRTEFSGSLAAEWNGQINYSFIDSIGHVGGIRPSLDADNFYIGDQPLSPLEGPPVADALENRASRRSRIKELSSQLASIQELALQERQSLNELLAKGPCEMAYGMAEGTPHNVRIQKRGEPDQPGAEVPRGLIKILGGEALPANTRGSGRLELANWLTQPAHPLTPRVMVNRIWQFHFGRGLVKTPNDFGARGLPPTHPELLDHLAARFIQSGWSIKTMHRLIMLSATYQQSSILDTALRDSSTTNEALDLYVGFLRRRLSAEEIRDSILSISGELDPTPAREHPFPTPTSWGFTQHAPFAAIYDHNQRSVYLMTQRFKRHPFLALFDGADPNATTADRLITTVPTQALYFLKDPFVHAKSQSWARRLLNACPSEAEIIQQAWQRALGRLPSAVEQRESTSFLTAYRGELVAFGQDDVEARALAALLRSLFGSNEFLYLD